MMQNKEYENLAGMIRNEMRSLVSNSYEVRSWEVLMKTVEETKRLEESLGNSASRKNEFTKVEEELKVLKKKRDVLSELNRKVNRHFL